MTEQQWIRNLDRARPVPAIDVADAVLHDIRAIEGRNDDAPFRWAALLALLSGGGAVAAAVVMYLSLADPLANFLNSFQLVLQ